MDEVRRAMLGDRDAQERLTERGVLLPCPVCHSEVNVYGTEDWKPTWHDPDSGGDPVNYVCNCGITFCIGSYDYHVTMKKWNTRTPILSAEELERLEDNHGE